MCTLSFKAGRDSEKRGSLHLFLKVCLISFSFFQSLFPPWQSTHCTAHMRGPWQEYEFKGGGGDAKTYRNKDCSVQLVSFMAGTSVPGQTWNQKEESIIETSWASALPSTLLGGKTENTTLWLSQFTVVISSISQSYLTVDPNLISFYRVENIYPGLTTLPDSVCEENNTQRFPLGTLGGKRRGERRW